jgi:hypothetical protein
MRRVTLALVSGVLFGLVFPSSAHAWWGWIDELSGAGRFRGWEVEARLFCFGTTEGDLAAPLLRSAADHVTSAFEMLRSVTASVKPKDPAAIRTVLDGFATLERTTLEATTSRIAPDAARRTRDAAEKLRSAVGNVCSTAACTDDQAATMARVAARLSVVENEYTSARILEERRRMLTASAGVSFSACPMQKDLTRRGAIGVTYRRMDTYGDRKEEFAGGNTISLSTLTPMASWRPLFDVANGKYDYLDLATGGGVYWLASDGDRPGGFDAFSGVILEPIRIDLHAPALSNRSGFGWGLVASSSFRFGYAIFPAGFAPNAFGATRFPEQSERIRGEWVKYWGVYLDVGRLIYYTSRGNQ